MRFMNKVDQDMTASSPYDVTVNNIQKETTEPIYPIYSWTIVRFINMVDSDIAALSRMTSRGFFAKRNH